MLLPEKETFHLPPAARFGRKKWLKIGQQQQQNDAKMNRNCSKVLSMQMAANCSSFSPKTAAKTAVFLQRRWWKIAQLQQQNGAKNAQQWQQIDGRMQPVQAARNCSRKPPKTAAKNSRNSRKTEPVLQLRWRLSRRQDDFKTQNRSVEMMSSRRGNV